MVLRQGLCGGIAVCSDTCKRWGIVGLACASLVGLGGCDLINPTSQPVYMVLEPQGRTKFPLEPHVVKVRARPSPAMIGELPAHPLLFTVLDKRTLWVHRVNMEVGGIYHGPWGGSLYARAFVPDLQIRDGEAVHGPEGHVNPATWIVITNAQGQQIHEGWLFSRDPALTAWDHPRFDITFLGVPSEEVPEMPAAQPVEQDPIVEGPDSELPMLPSGPLTPEDELPQKTG